MSETPLPIQNNNTENLISGTNDGATPHRDASSLVDSPPPAKTIETDEFRVPQDGDQIYLSQLFDTFPAPAFAEFLNSYQPDAIYSHKRFECIEESSLSYTEQYYLNSSFVTSAFGHPDARPGSLPAPVATAAPMYAPQDDMHRLFSTQAHRTPSVLPQSTPPFYLANNARPSLGTATSTTEYIGGASGHRDDPDTVYHDPPSPPFQPVAGPDSGSNMMFDTPVPYPTPDLVVEGIRRMRLDSQPSISSYPEIASEQPPVLSPPTGYAEPRYASPETIEANGQGHPSSVPESAYGGNDYLTHGHYLSENGTQLWREQMPTLPHGEAVSGHSHRSTFPLYSNSGHQNGGMTTTPLHYGSSRTMMFDHMPDPQFSLQVYLPPYAQYGQAARATMHAAGDGDNTVGSFASSDEWYNYLSQQPATWNGWTRPSTAANTTRAHRGTPSWPYHHRAPSSSASAPYPTDVAVSVRPRNVRPAQHRSPRQGDARFISPYHEPGVAFKGASSTPDGDHLVASSSAFADEDRTDCSPPPTTCPPINGLNAQQLLRRVLGPSPRLKNEALIQLVLLILHASFYRLHEMEPTGDSEDGIALLTQLESTPGYTPAAFDASSNSIFTLLVSRSKFRCLICGSFKQSMVRAIGCIRSHLNHRPFPCLGEDGCRSCPKGQIVKRFFTASLLHDHCSKQERAIDCTYCGASLTSNIKRHWEAKHNHTPFPYDDYPNYIPE